MVTIYPRGLAFVAVAVSILVAMDRFDIDWRVGLIAVSLDAMLTLFPLWAGHSTQSNETPPERTARRSVMPRSSSN
jgi:hypothetical protein